MGESVKLKKEEQKTNMKNIHGNEKKKQIVYDLMTPEMLDVYWNYVDENGAMFCDLEDKKKRKADKKDYKKRCKNEKLLQRI